MLTSFQVVPNDGASHGSANWSPSANAALKMKEAESDLQHKIAEQEQRLAELQRQLQEKAAAEERLQSILQEKERCMQLELDKQKVILHCCILAFRH